MSNKNIMWLDLIIMKQGGFHYIGNQIKSHCPHHWPLKVKSLSHVRLFVTPWTVAYQAPLSMGFSRQGYWSGVLFPSPGHLPNPGIEPRSPTLQTDSTIWAIMGKKVIQPPPRTHAWKFFTGLLKRSNKITNVKFLSIICRTQ